MNRIVVFFIIVVISLTAISCNEERNAVQTENGEEIRIISLVPSITKKLELLGFNEAIIGHTAYCPGDNLNNSEIIASATEVSIEKVAALQPSVVFCSSLTSKRKYDLMRKMDIDVRFMPMPESYKEICDQFIELGEIIGKKDKAKHIVSRENKRVDSLRNLIPDTAYKPSIFIEIGTKPLFAATCNSFMHDYIRFLNGKNIAEGMGVGSISREKVLAEDPDVIFIVTMGVVAQEEKENWESYSNLSAAKNDNIFVVDADKTSSVTPVTFTEVLAEFIELVYYNNQ